MTLFDLPPLTPGYLSTTPPEHESVDARRTRRNRELLAAGTHPATQRPVLDAGWGFTCRDCAHAEHVGYGRRSWWKCACHRLGMSRSAASDIRISWPACTLLEIHQTTGERP